MIESTDNLLKRLQTSPAGLSSAEAEKRLKYYGVNTLDKSQANALAALSNQFKSSLIYLLIVAAGLSFWLGNISDGFVIIIILLVNTALGFWQEYRSQRAIEKLSAMISTTALVLRDNKQEVIDEKYLVPGDVVVIKKGDNLPADVRILEADGLLIDESILTGESVPVNKNIIATPKTEKDEALSTLYAGTNVENGECTGVVIATANSTQLGKIAQLSNQTKKDTQYQKSLEGLSNYLLKFTIICLAIIFIFKLILTLNIDGSGRYFLFIVALAIAVVPEALPLITTLTLSSGALKLAKKHVVIKKLAALEDLGNINILCTDKTGTLTENKQTIVGLNTIDDSLFRDLALGSITTWDKKHHHPKNTYDEAIVEYYKSQNQLAPSSYRIVKEIPFDPDMRRNRIILQHKNSKKYFLVVSGSPETLLELSAEPNQKFQRTEIIQDGKEGLRNFAIAYKEIKYSASFDILKNEKNLIFLGLVKLQDPLRASAKETVRLAEKLGIQIKILTGDSQEVANFIGQEIGLITKEEQSITGEEMETLSKEELNKKVLACTIFARVTPQQKYQIISILKQNHSGVGYQGDGINDAPALKLADVSIAVNTATDVAKENADIILLNKDLEVIINGIKTGRALFSNINKYIKHTMVGNFGNFLALAILYLFSTTLPLLPIQILLTSLITDLPLATIATDNVDLNELIKPQNFNIRSLMKLSLILGTITALFEFIYLALCHVDRIQSQTGLFVYITLLQLVVIFAVRNHSHFWQGKKPTFLLAFAILFTALVSLSLPYFAFTQKIFSFSPLSFLPLALILLLVALYLFTIDEAKRWFHKFTD